MLQPGTEVGAYVVETGIGSGGMAHVYRVTHRTLGSVHALKVLHSHLAADERTRARFLEEARIQAQMQHPGLVRVTDIVAEPGVAGLVMDYVEGRTLEQIIADGPVDAEQAAVWLRQGLATLGAIHRAGVVHRDLKPANLIVDEQGALRVMDFGVAKVDGGRRTATSATLGTLGYMSPEQIASPRDVDHRTDLFALGAVFYELLAGRYAFDGATDFETMQAVVNGDVDLDVIDVRWRGVLRKALAPRDERFADANAFAAALAAPEAIVPQPIDDAPVRTRRAWPWLMALGVTLGPLAIGSCAGLAFWVAGSDETSARTAVEHDALPGEWTEVRGVRLRHVPAGRLQMGSPSHEAGRGADEDVHMVVLGTDLLAMDTEVSQAQWTAVMGDNPSLTRTKFWNDRPSRQRCANLGVGPDLPVTCVTWFDAIAFANALSDLAGLQPAYAISGKSVQWVTAANGYRLPTEAEWEHLARAGGTEPYGAIGRPADMCDHANVLSPSSRAGYRWIGKAVWPCEDGIPGLAPGGSYEPNAFGLYDTVGNVAEWTWDWYGPYPDKAQDPSGPSTGGKRVVRGGSWYDVPAEARVARRTQAGPEWQSPYLGFRLVRPLRDADRAAMTSNRFEGPRRSRTGDSLPRSDVDTVVRKHADALGRCRKARKLTGTVIVRFEILPDGFVSTATVASSTLDRPAVERCVVAEFEQMVFPPRKGVAPVVVFYPVDFT